METRPKAEQDSLEKLVVSRREHMVAYNMAKYRMSREDAEDCVAAAVHAFFRAYDHTKGFAPITYLYTAGNTAIAHYIRKNKDTSSRGNPRIKVLSQQSFPEGFLENLSHDPFDAHHATMCAKDDLRTLWRSLSLREKQVLLAVLSGFSVSEAAEKMGVTASRGTQLMVRIRAKATKLGLNR